MLPPRPGHAVTLAGLLLAQSTAGCTRFQVQHALAPPSVASAGVELRTFENDRGRRAGEPFQGTVSAELWRRHDGHWELVHRGDPAGLTELDLPAGDYRIAVTGASTGEQAVPIRGRQERTFTVGFGQVAHVDLTMHSVPWEALLVVTVVVAAVVVVAIVANAIGGGGGGGSGIGPLLPHPGPAPLPLVPPGQARVIHAAPPLLHPLGRLPLDIWVNADVAVPIGDDGLYLSDDPDGPRVTDIAGPSGPEGELRVGFDPPMDPDAFDAAAFSLVGASGSVVTGIWSPDRGRSAVIHPLQPLPPGRYQLTVDAARLHTRSGEALPHSAALVFSVP